MTGFVDRLREAWKQSNSLVCVGLDPDLQRLPEAVISKPKPIFEFNRAIIDATADVVCCYKPQFAHYAAVGAEDQLEATINYIHDHYPTIPVILDAKRGDIGSTAALYAKEAFERYQADAVTVNPYLGSDSLQPFLAWSDRGVIILVRTSNPSAREIQDLIVDQQPLYEQVAQLAVDTWNASGNVLLVVGATYPEELARVRKIVGDIPLLVPGIGAQGGDVAAAVRAGCDSQGAGMIINSSRGIIYAGDGAEYAVAARSAAIVLRDQINQFRW